MKIKSKELIGKEIEWTFAHDNIRGTCLVAKGIVLDARGNNILMDDGQWLFLPELDGVKIIGE